MSTYHDVARQKASSTVDSEQSEQSNLKFDPDLFTKDGPIATSTPKRPLEPQSQHQHGDSEDSNSGPQFNPWADRLEIPFDDEVINDER